MVAYLANCRSSGRGYRRRTVTMTLSSSSNRYSSRPGCFCCGRIASTAGSVEVTSTFCSTRSSPAIIRLCLLICSTAIASGSIRTAGTILSVDVSVRPDASSRTSSSSVYSFALIRFATSSSVVSSSMLQLYAPIVASYPGATLKCFNSSGIPWRTTSLQENSPPYERSTCSRQLVQLQVVLDHQVPAVRLPIEDVVAFEKLNPIRFQHVHAERNPTVPAIAVTNRYRPVGTRPTGTGRAGKHLSDARLRVDLHQRFIGAAPARIRAEQRRAEAHHIANSKHTPAGEGQSARLIAHYQLEEILPESDTRLVAQRNHHHVGSFANQLNRHAVVAAGADQHIAPLRQLVLQHGHVLQPLRHARLQRGHDVVHLLHLERDRQRLVLGRGNDLHPARCVARPYQSVARYLQHTAGSTILTVQLIHRIVQPRGGSSIESYRIAFGATSSSVRNTVTSVLVVSFSPPGVTSVTCSVARPGASAFTRIAIASRSRYSTPTSWNTPRTSRMSAWSVDQRICTPGTVPSTSGEMFGTAHTYAGIVAPAWMRFSGVRSSIASSGMTCIVMVSSEKTNCAPVVGLTPTQRPRTSPTPSCDWLPRARFSTAGLYTSVRNSYISSRSRFSSSNRSLLSYSRAIASIFFVFSTRSGVSSVTRPTVTTDTCRKLASVARHWSVISSFTSPILRGLITIWRVVPSNWADTMPASDALMS
uniref:Uncharacterized protein n=1 Tax=Anopheles coluzzii TaxID=1518534 RepID=A0A8W7PY00_ANOCL